jgi:hypothetical protein
MKSLLGDFNTKLGREYSYIVKPTNGNGTLPKNVNDNGVRDANFVHQKILVFRLITYLLIADDIQVYSVYDLLEELTDTGYYLVIEKQEERLLVNKQQD